MKNKRILYLSLCMLFCLQLKAQNPCIQKYSASDGLPEGVIRKIFQDSKKFMWFISSRGISRYDGSTFTSFGVKEGLLINQVKDISEDSFGRIWLSLVTNEICYLYRNKIFNSSNTPFLDSIDSYEYFTQDADSVIYFLPPAGRNINIGYSLNKEDKLKRFFIPNLDDVMDFKKSSTGEFFIYRSDGIYKVMDLGKEEKRIKVFSPKPKAVFARYDVPYTYVNTYNSRTQKQIFLKYYDDQLLDTIELPSGKVFESKILEDSRGMIWVESDDGIIYCIKNNQVIQTLDIGFCESIKEDHEHNIWISTSERVYKIKPCYYYIKNYDLSYFNNNCIKGLSDNPSVTIPGIWITTGKNQYFLHDDLLYTLELNPNDIMFNWLFAMKNNYLVLASQNYVSGNCFLPLKIDGINHLDKKVLYTKVFKKPKTSFQPSINHSKTKFYCYEDRNYRKIYSTEKGFGLIDSIFIGDPEFCITNPQDELIIIGERKYIIKNGKKVPYTLLDTLKNRWIWPFWIGGFGDLFRDANGQFYLYRNKRLLNLESTFDYPIEIISDKGYFDSTLIINTNHYLYSSRNFSIIFEDRKAHIQIADIYFNNIKDYVKTGDNLYVASDEGLTAIPWTYINNADNPAPIPYFKSVKVNETEAEWTQENIRTRSRNRISVEMGSINFSSLPVIFSYMIDGLDTSWTIVKNSQIILQGLPPGKYTFKMRVCKPTLPWSDPIELSIKVLPTFWQHPLFYTGLVLLFGALLSWFIIRRKNIQFRRRELDHQLVMLEQKALQSMMNPHFIFNALGSIQNYLIQNKSDDAGIYLSQFARLIRQNLGAISSGFINLGEEIERLRNYLDLEQMRLRRKFEYKIEVDETLEEETVVIPSMVIQPIVENSIWHGISGLESSGEVSLSFIKESEKSIRITVEDNGLGMKNTLPSGFKGTKHLRLGSELTRKRLEMLGKKMGVTTSVEYSELNPDSEHPGTRVVMVVPLSLTD